jgi:hypothetical protein
LSGIGNLGDLQIMVICCISNGNLEQNYVLTC